MFSSTHSPPPAMPSTPTPPVITHFLSIIHTLALSPSLVAYIYRSPASASLRCGHCKHLIPTWQLLPAILQDKGVFVGAVDCT